MALGTQILLSGVLTFGIPVILALREFVVLKQKKNRRPPDDQQPPPPLRPTPPADIYARPLPACLIPKRSNVRILDRV